MVFHTTRLPHTTLSRGHGKLEKVVDTRPVHDHSVHTWNNADGDDGDLSWLEGRLPQGLQRRSKLTDWNGHRGDGGQQCSLVAQGACQDRCRGLDTHLCSHRWQTLAGVVGRLQRPAATRLVFLSAVQPCYEGLEDRVIFKTFGSLVGYSRGVESTWYRREVGCRELWRVSVVFEAGRSPGDEDTGKLLFVCHWHKNAGACVLWRWSEILSKRGCQYVLAHRHRARPVLQDHSLKVRFYFHSL